MQQQEIQPKALPNIPEQVQSPPKIKNVRKPVTPLKPVKIIIPSLHVKAIVETVGVLDNGQMAVPQDTEKTGLLHPGFLPGELGNAVIDGHVDNLYGPAVFFHLKKLKPNDQVILKDVKGRQLIFVVEATEIVEPHKASIEKIFGPSPEPRLNLITCTGKYNRKKHEHEERLIVYTKLVDH
ncbi:class F sortase [Paenibacillus selenitireducens]|nr:class F sortase [Paenibacillus selenitireducens]